jgi:hypothetical protein
MKKMVSIGILSIALILIGCGSDNDSSSSTNSNSTNKDNGNRSVNSQQNQQGADTNQSEDCNNSVDINGTPMSNLTPELKDAIAYMGNEERLAYDVYHNLYTYHVENSDIDINQLDNTSEKSEIKHVGIIQDIVNKYSLSPDELTVLEEPVANRDVKFEEMPSGKYGVAHIQELYDFLYAKGTESQKDALEVGCIVEVTDVNDLDKYIKLAEDSNATDVLDAFKFLRDGSYNHYWAFDNGLKSLGIESGCCSLGVIDGVDYCRPDFPNTEHNSSNSNDEHGNSNQGNQGQGQGQGQGNGNGQGHGHNS